MSLTECSYPFEYIGVSKTGADKYQQDTLIYRFRSSKSSHEYEVLLTLTRSRHSVLSEQQTTAMHLTE